MKGILDLTESEYHGDQVSEVPTLSKSIAHLLLTCSPCHAWEHHPRLNPNWKHTDEDRFDLGTAAHSMLLQGSDSVAVLPFDSYRTKEAKEAKQRARDEGKIPMLEAQKETLTAMLAAAGRQIREMNEHHSPALLDLGGHPEKTIVWDEGGVMCRAKLDWLHDDFSMIDDYKTTSASAHPEKWTRTLFATGADLQFALYRRAVKSLTGVAPGFRWIVQETYPPFAMSVVTLSAGAQALAEAKLDSALEIWADCLASDSWPAYPIDQIAYAEAPSWEMMRWLES